MSLFIEERVTVEIRVAVSILGSTNTGRGISKDENLARPLYEKACDTGEPIGCRNLGNFYIEGRGGVVKDEARGRALWQKACKGGDDTACLRLEETK